MSPFKRIPPNPVANMIRRERLLAAPADAYRHQFNGRLPTLQEKLHAVELAVQNMTAFEIYGNEIYTVELRRQPPFIHVSIQRNDGQPCFNWRDFQQIKNELVGPENEAFEIFPAESRLVDSSHRYHLWAYEDSHCRIPVGFTNRFVTDEPLERIELARDAALARSGQLR